MVIKERSIKKVIEFIIKIVLLLFPPPQWRVPVFVLAGLFAGLGVYTLYIANAFSYLSDDPKTCMNCHIMGTQYAGWLHSSHRERASCNDCHVPQDNIISHYYFKAMDGLRHSAIFTARMEPQAIKIKAADRRVVQANCRRCHERTLFKSSLSTAPHTSPDRACWDCHRYVPHGRTRSLSSNPNAHVPTLPGMAPLWIKKIIAAEKNGTPVRSKP